jgi:hypothetical protein
LRCWVGARARAGVLLRAGVGARRRWVKSRALWARAGVSEVGKLSGRGPKRASLELRPSPGEGIKLAVVLDLKIDHVFFDHFMQLRMSARER